MVSNADLSTITPATRMVGNASREFAAPTCIDQYNGRDLNEVTAKCNHNSNGIHPNGFDASAVKVQ
jgi:hypothetical protein